LNQNCVACNQYYKVSPKKYGAARNTCSPECLEKWFKAADKAREASKPAREPKPYKSGDGRKYRYSLSDDAFNAMLAEQDYCCLICGRTEPGSKGWQIDHDHSCCEGQKTCGACVRGILCVKCNVGLGYFDDSENRLELAAEYLRSRKVDKKIYASMVRLR
jgi:hypothetical protein